MFCFEKLRKSVLFYFWKLAEMFRLERHYDNTYNDSIYNNLTYNDNPYIT